MQMQKKKKNTRAQNSHTTASNSQCGVINLEGG